MVCRVLFLGSVLLVNLVCGLLCSSAWAGDPSFATQVVEEARRPMQHWVLGLPAGHGYQRGAWLGYYVPVGVPGTRALRVVGYGQVVETYPRTLRLSPLFLPQEDKRKLGLRVRRLPEDTHIGKALGQALGTDAQGRWWLNVGAADGVQVGDVYEVRGAPVVDGSMAGQVLGFAEPKGLLQVVEVKDQHALLRVQKGKVDRRDWLTYSGPSLPPSQRRRVVVLIVRFTGVAAESERFTAALRSQLEHRVLRDRNDGLEIRYSQQPLDIVDGRGEAARALGRQEAADLVVWGSVSCTAKAACVRPRVTLVDEKALGEDLRLWGGRSIPAERLGQESELADVDRNTLGLAERLAGMAYYQQGDCANAVYHLAQVKQGQPEDARAVQTPLFVCYEMLGSWEPALAVAWAQVKDGEEEGALEEEAEGYHGVGIILKQRGEVETALRHLTKARDLAQRANDTLFVAHVQSEVADILHWRGHYEKALLVWMDEVLPVYKMWKQKHGAAVVTAKIADSLAMLGQEDKALMLLRKEVLPALRELKDKRSMAGSNMAVADILKKRGQVKEALRILKEEVLPEFETLGDRRSAALTKGKIADLLAQQGQVEQALRIRREEVLPVYEQMGDKQDLLLGQANLAFILLSRGKPEDRDEARLLLEQAAAAARSLKIHIKAIRRLQRQAGFLPPAAPAQGAPAGSLGASPL